MRRIAGIIAALACALAAALAVPAPAQAQTYSGTSGTVAWSLDTDTGELHFKPESGTEGTFASNTHNHYDFWPWYQYRTSIRSVASEGTLHGSGSMYGMFYCCSSLALLDVSNWDTSEVTDMDCMFLFCSKLASLDVSNWDTSNVTDMNGMFDDCSSLTSLDVSNWDTSEVTRMQSMFYCCSSLTSLDVSNWDTSKVTSMQAMFYCCSSLALLDVSDWNTSKVTSMYQMFDGCSGLTSLDLSSWDTSGVTNVTDMFSGCSNLSRVDIGPNVTSNVVGELPTPSLAAPYTGKWVREDGSYGPYTTPEFSSNWNGQTMSGTWVWDVVSYTVTLDANGGTGSMLPLKTSSDVTVPPSTFRRLGYDFVGWNTSPAGTGTSYIVGATLTPTADMTLYAQWLQMPTTADYAGGMTVTTPANQQVTIDGLPAGASYEVTETPVPSGWTLVRSRDTTGVITPTVS